MENTQNQRKDYSPLKGILEESFLNQRMFVERMFRNIVKKEVQYYHDTTQLDKLLDRLELFATNSKVEWDDSSELDRDLEQFRLATYRCGEYGGCGRDVNYGVVTKQGLEVLQKMRRMH